jgi:hypothetical protein
MLIKDRPRHMPKNFPTGMSIIIPIIVTTLSRRVLAGAAVAAADGRPDRPGQATPVRARGMMTI